MSGYKAIVVSILLFVLIHLCATADGDTIIFTNTDNRIDSFKVVGVTEEYIKVTVLKKDIKALNMQFLKSKHYSDVMSFNTSNMVIECKVTEITDDFIYALIPTASISSLQISFQPGSEQSNTVPAEASSKAKTVTGITKEEKKIEAVVEQQKSGSFSQENFQEKPMIDQIRTSPAGGSSREKSYRIRAKRENLEEKNDLSKINAEDIPDEIDKKNDEVSESEGSLRDELQDDKTLKQSEDILAKEKPISVNGLRFGKIEGKILRSGTPLSDCRVKLQILEKVGLLTKGYRPVEGAVEFETTTDKEGVYHFTNMPPGLYKIYWKPAAETEWVRRFKMEPDVVVEPGKLINPKTIETLKRTLN